MRIEHLAFFVNAGVLWLPTAFAASFSSLSCDTEDIISRDVCVVGGGASGTYAAVRLHDLGKTVALVEQKGVLGGQAHTYTDPNTNQAVEYGVRQYLDMDVVAEFLDRLDVPFNRTQPPEIEGASFGFDFKRGQLLPVEKKRQALSPPLKAYYAEASKYPYLEDGFNLPDPIPEDLLLPFGEYVKKVGLEDSVPIVRYGLGDVLKLPTIYVFKEFSLGVLHSIRSNFILTANRNNSQIYEKALEVLGLDNVFLSTQVIETERDGSGVSLCLDTPTGKQLLRAKKLVVSIPPQLHNLGGFDLSQDERSLFSRFSNIGYFTSLVHIPGLPFNASGYNNVDPELPYNLPVLPAVYRVMKTEIPDLYAVEYGAPRSLASDLVQSDILKSLRKFRQFGVSESDEEPYFVRFENHSPYRMYVSSDEIRSGFYQKLYALQGSKNTFCTGATFHAQDSSLLWRFTEGLVQDIVGEMQSAASGDTSGRI